VVNTLPSSTTNITGLRIITRGFSFTNESPIARRTMVGSNIDAAVRVRTFGGRTVGSGISVSVMVTTGPSEFFDEMLDHRAECDDREVGEADDDHDDPREQRGEERGV